MKNLKEGDEESLQKLIVVYPTSRYCLTQITSMTF